MRLHNDTVSTAAEHDSLGGSRSRAHPQDHVHELEHGEQVQPVQLPARYSRVSAGARHPVALCCTFNRTIHTLAVPSLKGGRSGVFLFCHLMQKPCVMQDYRRKCLPHIILGKEECIGEDPSHLFGEDHLYLDHCCNTRTVGMQPSLLMWSALTGEKQPSG